MLFLLKENSNNQPLSFRVFYYFSSYLIKDTTIANKATASTNAAKINAEA